MSKKGPSQDPNQVKGKLGEKEGKKLLEQNGFSDVKNRESNRKGYDLNAKDKDGKPVTIEVKTTESKNEIPDALDSEFCIKDGGIFLAADYLLVVRLTKKEDGKYLIKGAHLIPKADVDVFKKDHHIKKTVVFSGDLKNYLKKAPEYWIDSSDKRQEQRREQGASE